jgi:hypothetical protein
LLNGPQSSAKQEPFPAEKSALPSFESLSFVRLCKLGLAITWPLVIVALAALGVFVFILVGRK